MNSSSDPVRPVDGAPVSKEVGFRDKASRPSRAAADDVTLGGMALSSSHAESTSDVEPADAGRAEVVGPLAPTSEDESTLTIAQAARLAGVSPATVHRRIVDGDLPATKDGRVYRLTRKTVLEIGPALRKRDTKADRARDVGALAAQCFPMFAAATPLDEVVIALQADPDVIAVLFEKWKTLRAMSVGVPAATPGPAFDHPPAADWTCCPGHQAMHAMEKR